MYLYVNFVGKSLASLHGDDGAPKSPNCLFFLTNFHYYQWLRVLMEICEENHLFENGLALPMGIATGLPVAKLHSISFSLPLFITTYQTGLSSLGSQLTFPLLQNG